jgi:hypothetical protein
MQPRYGTGRPTRKHDRVSVMVYVMFKLTRLGCNVYVYPEYIAFGIIEIFRDLSDRTKYKPESYV